MRKIDLSPYYGVDPDLGQQRLDALPRNQRLAVALAFLRPFIEHANLKQPTKHKKRKKK